jgi:hypothetical protein
MKSRPWPLVILAVLQLFSPIATVFFNAFAFGVKPTYVIQWILEKPPLQVFEALFLMPIAGIAIYQMKRWGYFVFFTAMVWGLVSNLRAIGNAQGAFSPGIVIVLFALPMCLALYFLLPSVRRTYFDPSVRWWEAARRFLLEVPLVAKTANGALQAKIQNISEGGVAFVAEDSKIDGLELDLSFQVSGVSFAVRGQVMYSIAQAGGTRAYGVRFLHTPETKKQFSRLMKGLELIGVVHRDQEGSMPWYLAVMEWAATLVTTGKGLVPEVKSSRKS